MADAGGDSGPYRRSLPQVRQVFCGDCRHHRYEWAWTPLHQCFHPDATTVEPRVPDPIHGPRPPRVTHGHCYELNDGLDCKRFQPIPPREPWWVRFLAWLCRHPKGQ